MSWRFFSKRVRRKAESDVEPDPGRVDTRAVDGGVDPGGPNRATSTGSMPNQEFVGRIAGSDLGYADETGAERRAGEDTNSAGSPELDED